MDSPPIDHRSMLHNYIKKVSHIEECTYTHVTYRRMHIYAWQMDPPFNCPYIHATPLHPISFIYSRMHIYPWKMDPI